MFQREHNCVHTHENSDKTELEFQTVDEKFMSRALELANQAYAVNEVPVGAVLVKDNQIIGEGYNQPISLSDPTAHAEIMAIRSAAQSIGNYRLVNTTLYVTLEPCAMCVGAIIHARVQRLVFAAQDAKTGAICSAIPLLEAPYHNHKLQWAQGPYAAQSIRLLQAFFQERR